MRGRLQDYALVQVSKTRWRLAKLEAVGDTGYRDYAAKRDVPVGVVIDWVFVSKPLSRPLALRALREARESQELPPLNL